MKSTFEKQDVTLLLKNISGQIKSKSTKEREAKIQSGTHYSEMLPIETKPTDEYMKAYYFALKNFSQKTADALVVVSEKIWKHKNRRVVIVSLARAGTCIGILIKYYLEQKYNVKIPHYSISIIRGREIDKNAINYILKRHDARDIQFVDGWIGKGAILRELEAQVAKFPKLSPELAVLSDPAQITKLFGTREDFLIPSACLNSTITGLISRTVLRDDLISKDDFHGAVYYGDLLKEDKTYQFINTILYKIRNNKKINLNLDNNLNINLKLDKITGIQEVDKIAKEFNILDINLIKPGIGDTTRVLLRRVPNLVLINPAAPKNYVDHIIQLAKEKDVEILYYNMQCYNACGIIKNLNADI